LNILVDIAPALAIAVVVAGIFGYVVSLAIAVYSAEDNALGARLRAWFEAAPAQNLGLPCAAVAAFSIVTILLHAFPSTPNGNGVLALKAFGLEFTGPSGPITLWLMCFMGFVIALKLLR
jgi:hypothetical protein